MFNILLQVLDDGRLTDGQGRTVDFRKYACRDDEQIHGSAQIQEPQERAEDWEIEAAFARAGWPAAMMTEAGCAAGVPAKVR